MLDNFVSMIEPKKQPLCFKTWLLDQGNARRAKWVWITQRLDAGSTSSGEEYH